MEYFRISQLSTILNPIELYLKPKAPNKIKVPFDKAQADQLKDIATIYMKSDEMTTYPDLYDNPSLLVSDALKELLALYDNDIIFKCAVFTNPKTSVQKIYWLTLIDTIECLSEQTQFYGNQLLKNLVIDKSKAVGNKIFRVKGIKEEYVYVNLDIAESILRRDFVGIHFEKVQSI